MSLPPGLDRGRAERAERPTRRALEEHRLREVASGTRPSAGTSQPHSSGGSALLMWLATTMSGPSSGRARGLRRGRARWPAGRAAPAPATRRVIERQAWPIAHRPVSARGHAVPERVIASRTTATTAATVSANARPSERMTSAPSGTRSGATARVLSARSRRAQVVEDGGGFGGPRRRARAPRLGGAPAPRARRRGRA